MSYRAQVDCERPKDPKTLRSLSLRKPLFPLISIPKVGLWKASNLNQLN